MIGFRSGKLVVERQATDRGDRYWFCKCDCGNTTVSRKDHLIENRTKSCGCFRREFKRIHGHARRHGWSPTYRSFIAMHSRCYRQTSKSHLYRDRGIKVCRRWFSFSNFLTDLGDRPKGKTIDRINGELGYEPSNCRWATPLEQSHNSKKYKGK